MPTPISNVLTGEMKQLLAQCLNEGVELSKIEDYLLAEGLVRSQQLALLAPSEEKFQSTVLQSLEWKKHVPDHSRYQVAGTMLYLFCRAAWDRKKDPAAVEVIDSTMAQSIEDQFLDQHGLKLRAHRRVDDKLMKELSDMLAKSPPQFDIIPLERLHLLSSISKKVGSALQADPNSKNVVVSNVAVDETTTHHVLWCKIRALFRSIALLCINNPSFFCLQTAEDMEDRLLDYMGRKYGHSRPPVSFFNKAYLETMQFFQEEVRTEKRTLRAVVESHQEWSHIWKSWTNNQQGPGMDQHGWQKQQDPGISKEIAQLRSMINQQRRDTDFNWKQTKRSRPNKGKFMDTDNGQWNKGNDNPNAGKWQKITDPRDWNTHGGGKSGKGGGKNGGKGNGGQQGGKNGGGKGNPAGWGK